MGHNLLEYGRVCDSSIPRMIPSPIFDVQNKFFHQSTRYLDSIFKLWESIFLYGINQ